MIEKERIKGAIVKGQETEQGIFYTLFQNFINVAEPQERIKFLYPIITGAILLNAIFEGYLE